MGAQQDIVPSLSDSRTPSSGKTPETVEPVRLPPPSPPATASTPTAAADSDAPAEDSGIGSSFIGRAGMLFIMAAILIMLGSILGSLTIFWPPDQQGAANSFRQLLGLPLEGVSTEQRYFIIVLAAGALGGLLHSVRSLTWYMGNRYLKWSWAPLYLLLPFSGAMLALVFYFVLRAGFVSPAAVREVSPFSIAALGSLVGLFSEQALLKLKTVAETVFTPPEEASDAVPAKPVGKEIASPAGGVVDKPAALLDKRDADPAAASK